MAHILVWMGMIASFMSGFMMSVALLLFGFYRLITMPPQKRTKPFKKFAPIHLPQKLLKLVQSGNWRKERETVIVANLIMQCIFREWKDSITLRRLVLNKLTKEFADAQRGAAGKIFGKIQLRELDFGSDFLTLSKVAVENVTLHETWKTIEELDVFVGMEYAGGFTLAVDAELVIGGVASLSVKITHVSGKARLQFTRKPYSHWSFAFYEEPKVVISVESSIQGQNFPQIANIITGQIRRNLRGKHTLPSYRIRFKPFFLFPELRINPPMKEKISQSGPLEITVVECSRLVLCEGSFQLYCMISLDDTQWINMDKVVGTPWIYLELEVTRPKGVALGIEFRQALIEGKFREVVIVDSIAPNSPFAAAGLVEGDVVTSIRNTDVTDAKQALRLLSRGGERILIKVERKSEFKWQKSAQEQPTEIKTKVGEHTVHSTTAVDETRTRAAFATKSSIANLLVGTAKAKKVGDSNEILSRAKTKGFPIKRTTYVLSTREPVFLESFNFEVKNNYKYINVGIWSKGQIISLKGMKKPRVDTMLGYTSIPLAHVLEECKKTTEGYHAQVVKLLCPEFQQLPKEFVKYAVLSGFDPRLCYGDITLRFVFKGEYKTKAAPGSEDIAGKASTVRIEEPVDNIMELDSSPSAIRPPVTKSLNHNFEEVTLKKSTTCKFCEGRIWLSTCLRCKDCRMIIHKKCEALCRQKTICKQVIWPDEDVIAVTASKEGGPTGKAEAEMMKLVDDVKKVASLETRSPGKSASPAASDKVSDDRKFFKSLEMTDEAKKLNPILDSLGHRGFGMRMFAVASEQAKFLHEDLKGDQRMKRIRNVYQKVKTAFEEERRSKEKEEAAVAAAKNDHEKTEANASLARCEQRLKGLNLVLLYYACGLKHLYDEKMDHTEPSSISGFEPPQAGGSKESPQQGRSPPAV